METAHADDDRPNRGSNRPIAPQCVATASSNSIASHDGVSAASIEPGFFRSAQWSADGTCIVTNSEDHALRTFVLPTDLLSTETIHDLKPYTTIPAPEPVYAAVLYPFYELSNPASTLLLSSTRDHPLRLHNTLQTQQLAAYPLINPTTEAFVCPHSLLFTPSGTHFLAGSDSLLSCFDISRSGEGPAQRLPTIPSKRKKIVGGGVGMKGIVSALSVSCDGIVAAGTYTRNVGLYSDEGRGECISVFSVAEGSQDGIGGTGITQTAWSPDGRYLYVAERLSDGIVVFDIRVTGKRLGTLDGRKAKTNQRLDMNVVTTGDGHEIWAGGIHGSVTIWQDPHATEGQLLPSAQWHAHDDAVSSAVVHPFASVAATSSGSRGPRPEMEGESTSPIELDGDGSHMRDHSLKVWAF